MANDAADATDGDEDTTGAMGAGADAGEEGAAGDEGEDAEAGEGETGPEVVATLLKNPDGTYEVVEGDEDEEGEGEGAAGESEDDMEAGAGEGDEAGAAGAAGAGAGEEAPAEHLTLGEALKKILDIAKEGEESAGEPGSADDQLEAGFSEGKEGTPATKPGSGRQKYPTAEE